MTFEELDPRVVRAGVTFERIDVVEHAHLVERPEAGAVVTFSGVVRNHAVGRVVELLEYEAHPNAGDVVVEIAVDVASKFDIQALAVTHRVGSLRIGDCALAVAVSASHRTDAFAAASELVDEVKRKLPVWKRQVFEGGDEEWVGSA